MQNPRLQELIDEVHVWYGRVPPDPAEAASCRCILDPDECARADRYRFPDLQYRFTQRRALMRRVLGVYLGLDPSSIQLETNAFGKPFLRSDQNPNDLQFSLTHSKDWMALAVTRQRDVGVDLEVVRDDVDFLGLAESFFASEDVAHIRSVAEPAESRRRFFEVWTCKEAYIKAIGAGLSIPLDQFSVALESDPARLRYSRHNYEENRADPAADWAFNRLQIGTNTTSWLATFGRPFETRTFSFETLLL